MKKFLKNGLLFASAALFLFTACDSVEDAITTAPSVTVTVEDPQDEYDPGDVIDLVVDFSANAAVVGATINTETEDFTITLTANGIANNIIDLNAFNVAGNTEGSFTIPGFEIPEEAANLTLSFTVEMEDEEGRLGEGTLNLEIADSDPVRSFTNVLVFAPAGDGSTNTWFSTNLGETVTEAEVNASAEPSSIDVDFGYYYGNSDQASISSPNAYPTLNNTIDISDWNTRNSTEFKLTTISDEEYIGIKTSADLATVWSRSDNVNQGETITNLEVGDVVAFQLDTENKDGLYGVFKVIAITPGTDSNDSMEIEVLVQD